MNTIEHAIGNTPLVKLQRIPQSDGVHPSNILLGKCEGNNPAGSVKDRAAMSMIVNAELRGEIKPGDTLIEATSGNTGIALAMAAAIKGYKMVLIMPDNLSVERRQTMLAYGAQLILTPRAIGMEGARDTAQNMAEKMQREQSGGCMMLNQFSNPDNPLAHYQTTGPEIWRDTAGKVTHFVATMGTTGTIMGVSRYLKQMNPAIKIIGVQPADGSVVPGIRKWPQAYLPAIYDAARVDTIMEVTQTASEEMTRRLAKEEGIFAVVSSGGGLVATLEIAKSVNNAVIVHILCDRGDRYLSTGVFPG
jgi:cysteine synthase B